MLDYEKVKLMTKLAIYEKNIGKEDIKKFEYFKTDYISINNFKVQISVTLALLLIFGVNFTKICIENLATITEYNFVGLGIKYLAIWLALMVIYTIISTITLRASYARSQKRIEEYERLLKNLEKIQ